MKALIIVDVQNDFCTDGALEVPGGESIIPRINELQKDFSLIVATQDWHPPEHISFASTHGKQPGETAVMDHENQILWPDHCVQGTRGADFHPTLDLTRVNLILRKGMSPNLDSYSAFLENDHRTSTGLTGHLKSRGVTSVVLCGLATDFCVYFSAKDCREAGFETTVLCDAVKGVDVPEGNIQKALDTMKKMGISLIDSQEL